ncbi:MAG: AraC family transcriptional regulator [Oscillospiraceae bacterium]|nr:AraC family transcriptional regulator [Oscillospiraceae bacterium]
MTDTHFMTDNNVVKSNRIIYTSTAFARTNLIYLQEVGELNALRPHESKRTGLSSYLFFIVKKGSGTLTVGGTRFEMTEGDCGFVNCSQEYSHRSSDDLWQLQWVHFYGYSMDGIFEKYRERGGEFRFRPIDGCGKLSEIISEIYRTASGESYIRDMEINGLLSLMLTEIMRNSWNPERHGSDLAKRNDLQSVRDYLDENYRENIRLDDLAIKFYISKYYLAHIFKEQYGTTINGYLTQVRITNAKKHLRFSDRSLESIGADCGYSDVNYFIRMFKKAEGMTPSEFRRRWRA